MNNLPETHYDSREVNVARIASLGALAGKYVRCVSGSHTGYTGLAKQIVRPRSYWFSNQNGNDRADFE